MAIDNNTWMFWEFFDEEGYYGFNSLDKSYTDTHKQTGSKKEYYLKVLIPEHKQIAGKFPLPETNAELQKLEEELIDMLENKKVDCKQVHRCIYFGAKRMLFEVEDISGFEQCIDRWKSNNLRDYGLETILDEPWVLYKELQPDKYARQQWGNRLVYNKLVSHGSVPEKTHLIEHAVFGEPDNLRKLEEELLKEGGKTLTFEDGMLEIGFESPLDLDAINSMTYFMMDKSEEFNCKYDGWSAALVK